MCANINSIISVLECKPCGGYHLVQAEVVQSINKCRRTYWAPISSLLANCHVLSPLALISCKPWSYQLGLITSLAVRLSALLLAFASQKIIHNIWDEVAELVEPSAVSPSVELRLKRLNQPLGWFQPRSVEVRLKTFQPHFNRFNRISTEPGNFWRCRPTWPLADLEDNLSPWRVALLYTEITSCTDYFLCCFRSTSVKQNFLRH